ncbi:MAG: hypothetical protein ABR575_08640, partial [Actinomycetota bacterium]
MKRAARVSLAVVVLLAAAVSLPTPALRGIASNALAQPAPTPTPIPTDIPDILESPSPSPSPSKSPGGGGG